MHLTQFNKEAYDLTYSSSEDYRQHYRDMIYYFPMWQYIISKLSKDDKILDLGCGPGHLAHMLYDNGFKTFIGIDFSKIAIEMAKNKVPSYTFIEADLRQIDFSEYKDFKFVSTETLEHLENDIELIKKLPKNRILFSVPNYKCIDHYRTYNGKNQIKDYYKDVLNVLSVKSFLIIKPDTIYAVEADII